MRVSDRIQATLMHATARWTVHYGADLAFAGTDLPRPTKRSVPTRHGKVPVHVYVDPAWGDEPRGVYVHFHGGAWLMRYPQMDDFWCRYVAAQAGVAVVNVDFRTGPYVAYPVAQEQGHDVSAAIAADPTVVGLPAAGPEGQAVAVGGLSSGGGLAASVCLQARDRGSFRPRLQMLGVPALDLASDLPASSGMISPGLRALVRRVYFPDEDRRAEPYASPVLAPDLSDLPPALILTAERDSLRPDGERYAKRLREAGVEVTYDLTPDADHYFLTDNPRRARDTMALMAAEIATALGVP